MQRIVQNFRNGRAWLWHPTGAVPEALAASLEAPLRKLGVTLERTDTLDIAGLDCNRDILLVDSDGDLDPARFLPAGGTLPPAPIVGLVGVEAPGRLKALVALGVTSFLRKPVHGAAVYPSLFLAVNGYHRLRGLERRLTDHDSRRRGRRFVIKAVVHLVVVRGMSDDDAYALLRRESMRQRQAIEEYCEGFMQALADQRPPHHEAEQETGNAAHIDQDSRGRGDAGDTDRGGLGRRPDQARRA